MPTARFYYPRCREGDVPILVACGDPKQLPLFGRKFGRRKQFRYDSDAR